MSHLGGWGRLLLLGRVWGGSVRFFYEMIGTGRTVPVRAENQASTRLESSELTWFEGGERKLGGMCKFLT